jgi:nitroreductase
MNISVPKGQLKSAALAKRYGPDAIPAAGPWNEHIELLLSHRSIRGYKSEALPEGTLETLIAAAQSAATSSNMQTWSVVAVKDGATKAAMAKLANNQKHIMECPLFLVWLADVSRHQRLGAEEGIELEVIPYLETFLVAAIDAALAAQNAVVAAESLGLSTVYIGSLRNDPIQVKELLGLPASCMSMFGLCVGYAAADVTNEVKPRLSQPAVLFREKYGNPDEPRLRAAYDQKMADFSGRHEMAQSTWTERVIDRLGAISAISGREKLSQILKDMGFPLR